LLIRSNKYIDIKFNAHERFWNNIHQVAQDQKIGKPNNLIVLGTQYRIGKGRKLRVGKGEGLRWWEKG
jgi:hypothetical protein